MNEHKQNKYKAVFISKVTKQIDEWKTSDTVRLDDIRRFLHNVKGTGLTIGLPLWSMQAELLLDEMEKQQETVWEREEFLAYLRPLSGLLNDSAADTNVVVSQKRNYSGSFVLLVTADISRSSYMKSRLEQQIGCTVLAVDAARKAIHSFFRYQPDLVIIDDGMIRANKLDTAYLHQKLEQENVPVMLISGHQIEGLEKHWDAVIHPSFQQSSWIFQCERFIGKVRSHKTGMESIEKLEGQWPYVKHWLKHDAVLTYLNISGLKHVNESQGFEQGDVLVSKLEDILKGSFPNAALYRGKDGFFLLVKSSSASSIREKINKKIKEGFEHPVTVRSIKLDKEESIQQAVRKLRDGYALREAEGNLSTKASFYIGIIDDDDLVRDMLVDQFKTIPDVNVASFREGESFFNSDWHKQDGTYLLIVDGMMPRMDGYEVVHRLRKEYDHEKYSILMLTGRKSENDIVRAMELGVDDYVTKPFGIRELDARVRRLLKRLEE